MADITDAEAVRFCNEVIRPLADKAAAYYYASLVADLEANTKQKLNILLQIEVNGSP